MKKIIALLLTAIMILSLPVIGLAAEGVVTAGDEAAAEPQEIQEAGITPDSWLYGLDNFMKELQLLITFGAAEKADLLNEISGERLAEAREMVEANKDEYGLIAMKAYKAALEKAIEVLDDAIVNNKGIGDVLGKFAGSLAEREKLITLILEEMPEEIRSEIMEELQETTDDVEVTIDVADYDENDQDTDDAGADVPDAAETDTEDTDEVAVDNTNAEETAEDAVEEDTAEDKETDEALETDEQTEEEQEVSDGAQDNTVEDTDAAPALPLKKAVTAEVLNATVGEDAAQMFAAGELNLRQIITIASLAEQTEKSFEEVLAVFLENGKGIGATAKALQLRPKDALKGIKEVFKDCKRQIKEGFKEARYSEPVGKTIKGSNKEANTQQEADETAGQTPAAEEEAADSSRQADETVDDNDKDIKQWTGQDGKEVKASGSLKKNWKKEQWPDKDDEDGNKDNDDDDLDKSGWQRNNKYKNEKQKTNSSYNRSNRAKERSNRK